MFLFLRVYYLPTCCRQSSRSTVRPSAAAVTRARVDDNEKKKKIIKGVVPLRVHGRFISFCSIFGVYPVNLPKTREDPAPRRGGAGAS